MDKPSYEDARNNILSSLAGYDEGSTEYLNAVKALELLNKAESAHPEAVGVGAKAWFEKHSDALIKVGGTLSSIVLIGFVESKFDVIFRSKASKYL